MNLPKTKKCNNCGKLYTKLPAPPIDLNDMIVPEDRTALAIYPVVSCDDVIYWNCSCHSTLAYASKLDS